jgi:uncharacterized protein YegJ (DUF2314 family)
MKKILIAFAILALSSTAYSGDTHYEDMPIAIDTSFEALLDQYVQKAKMSLQYFDEQFEKPGDRTFYIVTRIYKNELYEQVFVKLGSIHEEVYVGLIVSEPMGKVDFKKGEIIQVSTEDVVDWCIVNPDGTEEGNLLGKAADLSKSRVCAFISKMTPKDGVFTTFEVVSVLNPNTEQEIIEIVPQDVLDKVSAFLMKSRGGKPSKDNKEKYIYTIVSFPGWEILSD